MALVSQWLFDLTSNDTTGSNTLTANGTPGYAPGINSSGTFLNGSSNWYRTASHTNLDFSTGTNFSVMAWVKLASTGAAAFITNYNDPTMTAGWQWYMLNAGLIGFFIAGGNRFVTLNSGIGTNIWYHLVFTVHRSNGVNCYRNGLYNGQNTGVSNAWSASSGGGKLVVGCEYNPGARRFVSGIMDDVRVYNEELSAATIKSIYQSYHGVYGLAGGVTV